MPDAPRFVKTDIEADQAGWDSAVDDNFDLVEQFLDAQPTLVRRAYRVSASNSDTSKYLNLVNFDPSSYEGCQVWIMDVGGTGAPSGSNAYAFSDGTNWIWLDNGSNVASIS